MFVGIQYVFVKYTSAMRILLLFCFLLTTLIAHAQFAKKITGPIQTRRGITLKEGDALTLGRGSSYNGAFRYLTMGIEPEGASNDPLPTHYAGKSFPIKVFRTSQTEQKTKLFASLKANTLYTTFVDIEAAIDAKELVAVNGQEIGKPRPSMQNNTDNTLTANTESTSADAPAQGGMNLKQFSNDVNVRILSISGNKSQQTVTVNFVLQTELAHQQVNCLWYGCNTSRGDGKAYDSDGTEYKMKTVSLGNNVNTFSAGNKLPTSVPLKGSITFANVLPKVSTLSFITFFMTSKNYEGEEHCQDGNVEIRNAKIDWK